MPEPVERIEQIEPVERTVEQITFKVGDYVTHIGIPGALCKIIRISGYSGATHQIELITECKEKGYPKGSIVWVVDRNLTHAKTNKDKTELSINQ